MVLGIRVPSFLERLLQTHLNELTERYLGDRLWTGWVHLHQAVTVPTPVQTTFDTLAKSKGFTKRSGAWYLSREDTILVMDLQKSNYGPRYFVNVAVWLRALGEAQFPKEWHCHIRTRLTDLVPNPKRVDKLLDVEWTSYHPDAGDELTSILDATLSWVIPATESLTTLRTGPGQFLVTHSLVTGPAQRLLAEAG